MEEKAKKPSKKDFADLINRFTGENTMTEEKIDQFLTGAKKSYKNKGMNGFFDYIRKVTQAPISNEMMESILNQMRSPQGTQQLLKDYKIPLDLPNSADKSYPKRPLQKRTLRKKGKR
ncbi:hypothetical protein [Hazenella coriacea]|uniref:Uncharacterized protein n=1 Tax=Hazenella coriacea TaxID=1179467 RepID=A0A4R3L572_9BACL|nr:hypothetical protein [Hazenella coriacea]TCS94941.1 hypothetical protein EDD58_103366 [Hazenella coriacea]